MNEIILYAVDDVILFPYYLRYISNVEEKMKYTDTTEASHLSLPYIPYKGVVLDILRDFVERLPLSSRDLWGHIIEPIKMNQNTIFVNQLVKLSQKPSKIKNSESIIHLLYAAYFLNIRPLMNVFSSYIADYIYPLKTDLITALEHYTAEIKITPMMENNILKYLRLKELGISELTIADHIGLHGQPDIRHGKLDLSGEMLTSLEGLELIVQSEQVTELWLNDNFIGVDKNGSFDTYFRRLTQLKKIHLSGNKLSTFPIQLLQALENVKVVL